MRSDPYLSALAFRRGQLNALAQTHLSPSGLYTAELRHCLALRALSRTWSQYREDRAIALGARLVGGECAAERNAFLSLIAAALPADQGPLAAAIRTVRRIAVDPLADETRQANQLVATGTAQLDAVLVTLTSERLPTEPLERLLTVMAHHRYSLGGEHDPLTATAHSACWSINLLAVARPELFRLGAPPLPCPGLVARRLFRAELDPETRRARTRERLLQALLEVSCDIDRVWRAGRRFEREFAHLRSTSRLGSAWLLLFGLGELTPAQLARALPATNAGAGKLLRQLADGHLARANGSYEPFASTPIAAAAFADHAGSLGNHDAAGGG